MVAVELAPPKFQVAADLDLLDLDHAGAVTRPRRNVKIEPDLRRFRARAIPSASPKIANAPAPSFVSVPRFATAHPDESADPLSAFAPLVESSPLGAVARARRQLVHRRASGLKVGGSPVPSLPGAVSGARSIA